MFGVRCSVIVGVGRCVSEIRAYGLLFLLFAAVYSSAAVEGWDTDKVDSAIGNGERRAALEQELLTVLKSDAPFHDKRRACRTLRRVGSEASVPVLAGLLADARMTHMARFVLQQMPGAAARGALCDAVGNLKGKALVGVLDSLGERGEAAVVPLVAGRVSHKDEAVAVAALRALGKIGGQAATGALCEMACPGRDAAGTAWADALVDCAASLVESGKRDEAAAAYAKLEKSEVPSAVRPALLRGLLHLREKGRVAMLREALKDDDEVIRAVAGRFIAGAAPERELKSLLKGVDGLGAGGQTMLVRALAERGYEPGRKTVVRLARSKDELVRIASLRALAGLGAEDDVRLLVELGAAGGEVERKAARMTLTRLRGKDVEDEMLSLLRKSEPPVQVLLIRVLAERGAADSTDELMKLVSKADGNVKAEAMKALGRVVPAGRVSDIVNMVRDAGDDTSLRAAVGALRHVCTRVDRAARSDLAGPILAGLKRSEGAPRRELLLLLPMLADERALDAARSALSSNDGQTRDAALRALSSWPNSAPASDLLKLAGEGDKRQRAVAFRGYTRLIDRERDRGKCVEMCRRAAKLANRREDKKMLLSSLSRVYTLDAFRMATGYLDDDEALEEACAATIRIASRIVGEHEKEITKVMQRVVALTKNKRHKKQAEAILER